MIQWDRLKKPVSSQTALEMVTLDSLVPKDHLLRKIDAVIDFSFVHDRIAGLYCADNVLDRIGDHVDQQPPTGNAVERRAAAIAHRLE
ncbi:hypothetical protein [Rhizobium mongolense]|uniref:Transposase InsH N-terminal domain-containing protein n=2 Tax=Rhizobium mongolense TaxID=57676 RepID=A0ABR6IZA9_9HYPH|nr:hypothetical protein [Rhizobium mongolense]MBB4233258.1 hypothetical protein [Rhizobium mongolense]TVZ75296.1 hypothetical protein BCL32_0780 [Rhizobium mongolense USDA 1844]